MHSTHGLNNIMNRDTYITGKCAVIVGEILDKEFQKIYHNNAEEKIQKFIGKMIEVVERKVFLHLSMNRMDNYHIINLDSDYEFNQEEEYFFFKIDGIENFMRGIKNFSVMMGIIKNGYLSNWTCYLPMMDSTLWYQEEENMIYVNNNIAWSKNSFRKNNRIPPVYSIHGSEYDPNLMKNCIPYFNYNLIYDWFLLMNDSVDGIVMDPLQDKILKLIVYTFQGMDALLIETHPTYIILKKQLLINKII